MPAFLPSPLWAAQVAAATPLPDARLNTRLERLLCHLAQRPLDGFPQALPDYHQAKAAYRFLANERVSGDDLLSGLRAVTAQALRGQPLLYVPHDTTTFSYTPLKQTTGLGYISDVEAARGFHCHSSLALQADGRPLGLLHQYYWVRAAFKPERPQGRPIEDKESVKWLRGVEATAAALQGLPAHQRPRVVHLMDQEGDIHDVFVKVLSLGHGAIIRRCHRRRVAEAPGDADRAIARAPVAARLRLGVPAGHGRKGRTAVVELRSRPLTLTPHCHHQPERKPLRLNLVEVREVGAAPGGEEPIHWLLWTTDPARTKKQILAVVRGYALRWRIEDFHLIWKQGCRVEQLQLEAQRRLQKAAVLYAGVAVRLLRLRELARQEPAAPCTEVLTEEEWQALYVHATGQVPQAATPVPTIEQAAKWLGRLGGHLGRKRDGMPGVRTLWRGWRDLAILVGGYRAGKQHGTGPGGSSAE
jgi:hypothetical protein